MKLLLGVRTNGRGWRDNAARRRKMMIAHTNKEVALAVANRSSLLDRLGPLVIVGPGLFAFLILMQDLIEWDWLNKAGLNPIGHAPVSALEWSPIGLVQMANFFILGLATVSLAMLFNKTVARNRFTYPAFAMLLMVGVALMASTLRVDYIPIRGRSFINPPALHWMGVIHNIAFYFVAFPVTFGLWLVWARLRKDPRFKSASRHTLVQAIVMVPLVVVLFIATAYIFYFWLLVWLSWQTHLAIRVRQVSQSAT
jgi:hypothetical protein